MKNVQVPYEFLQNVEYLLIRLDGVDLDSKTKDMCYVIKEQIMDKYAAIDRRQEYSLRIRDEKNTPRNGG
jgi:hypothetical protein